MGSCVWTLGTRLAHKSSQGCGKIHPVFLTKKLIRMWFCLKEEKRKEFFISWCVTFFHFYNKCLAEIILKWRKLGFVLLLTHGFRDFSPWQMDSVDWVCGSKTTYSSGACVEILTLLIESYTIREGIFQKRFLAAEKYFSSWDAALWPLVPPLNSTSVVRTTKPCSWSLPRSIHRWNLGNVFC